MYGIELGRHHRARQTPHVATSLPLPPTPVRTVRKNKFVDFVGEYHLDLIVGYGAVPVIVPCVAGVHALLDSFEPIHGVLLCEGEDIDPSLYDSADAGTNGSLSPEQLEAVRRLHPSDAAIDHEKDSIELRLARRCLERNIPYLGICRGLQVLNVACGGLLYQDVEHELKPKCSADGDCWVASGGRLSNGARVAAPGETLLWCPQAYNCRVAVHVQFEVQSVPYRYYLLAVLQGYG
ncbi:unnamed protein product [Miscanthus lutarioriparius]|uniref:Uncharacterized protein n=1 Tax=Miscanthus lutarioriparius TaxID=422564 RepID=A0A811R173_9POAL|nr:unnamed protein product [Miscanthus lutarioriparius]